MRLKEQLLRRAALLWWSMQHKQDTARFTIPSNGLRAQHLAVILPPEFEDFDVARYALNEIIAKLQPYRYTILVRENYRSWLSQMSGARFLIYNPNRKDLLGFPENRSQKEARELNADVVIDLTPDFTQYTAGLAAATDAPLRVTLDKEHAASFYNLIIHPARGRSLQEQYHVLLNHI